MSLPLRDYQRAALNAVAAAHATGQTRVLIVLPTGAGKTVAFAHLIAERGGRAVVLAHRDELVEQAASKLRMVAPELTVGVCKAEREETHRQVIVASVQTLARRQRLERLVSALRRPVLFQCEPGLRTLVVDECHHYPAGPDGNTFGRVLEGLGAFAPPADGGPLTVGVTATPDPLAASGGQLAGGWQGIAYQLGILDGIRAGWLVDVRAKEVLLADVDFNDLHFSRGEIKADDAAEMLMQADAPRHAARAYLEHAAGTSALVFTPTIALAHAMAAAFVAAGVPAEAVDGQMPREQRRAILARLRAGETLVVPNAQVLTEGFDEPRVGAIIMARPTRSRPFALQCIGRGLRPYPGKTHCVVLDLVGAVRRQDLMTVSAMFGVRKEALERDGLLAASRPAPAMGTQEPEGRLVSRDLELFKGRAFEWIVAADSYALSLGHGEQVVVAPGAPERWDVLHTKRVREGSRWITQRKKLYAGLPMDYATGAAEDYMRRQGAERLNAKDAGWRALPATEPQRRALRRRGHWREGMTRGEASAALSALYGG